MPQMQTTREEGLECPESYGLGSRREGVLMELFVLTESGKTVGVFSSQDRVLDYTNSCPVSFDFIQSPDGIKTEERVCNYRTQRVLLNRVLTDA